MKKILSLTLALLMLVSAVPMVYAAENETDYTNGTAITLNGSGEEYYTVTVPATMSPGDTATVKAEGMWNSDKFLAVNAPSSVTLTYGAQTMDVAITGGDIMLIGNSINQVSKEVDISVEDASRLFGTWTGTLVYTVELTEKGDINRDGVIDEADYNILSEFVKTNGELTDNISAYGDLTGDGQVKSGDYAMLKNMLKDNGIEVASE